MDSKEHTAIFEYTYSAPLHNEVMAIRQKYMPPEVSKMEQLRQLDQSVTKKGSAASLSIGVISALILGLGMSCTMVWKGSLFVPGIVIGIIGILGIFAARPIYLRITEKERKRLAPQILKLADELSGT